VGDLITKRLQIVVVVKIEGTSSGVKEERTEKSYPRGESQPWGKQKHPRGE